MHEGPFGIRWFWQAVLGMLTVTAAVLAIGVIVDQQIWSKAAAAEAKSYTPPPLATAPPVVAVVGDSYTAGSDQDSGPLALWPAIAGAKLNVSIQGLAVGGSGYITVNTADKDHSTFVQRASKIPENATEVIFFGSRNDRGPTAAEITTAASSAYAEAKKRAPHAKLIVIGPPWVDSSPPSWIIQIRDGVHAAAQQAGAVWVDPIAAQWFPTGSGLIGTDDTHPTDAGHAHLATLIEPIITRYLPKSP